MGKKPVFVATHPRACSTAFERVFMTRREVLKCYHEPFGDAYYYGPERLGERFARDANAREESGFADATFQSIFDRMNEENPLGKRIFIKDMAQYFVPPNNGGIAIAPSLLRRKSYTPAPEDFRQWDNGNHVETTAHLIDEKTLSGDPDLRVPYPTAHEDQNPTVWPTALLEQFQFCFLIRHPHYSIPSYYRCTVPPLSEMTGFTYFRPDEAGYNELRRLFDYLRNMGFVGPSIAGGGNRRDDENGANGAMMSPNVDICVIDADDLLDAPETVIETFCETIGLDYSPAMLNWDNEEQFEFAKSRFEKWKGFHEDAIHSRDLKPREHRKKSKTDEQFHQEWVEKFGKAAADVIQHTVEATVADYEYLRQFAIKI